MITFNNIRENAQHDVVGNILTFTEIPNILKVEADGSLGTQAVCILSFDGDLRSTVSADSQYYITFLGETITNVMSPSDANNKRFFIDDDEDGVAMSVARAFRNCGSIAADFNIIFTGNYVKLHAKTVGQKWQRNPVSTNINTTSQYLNVNFSSSGTSSSVYTNGKIDVDVYSGDSSDDSNYVTTLEKNFYGAECAFDVSPVLATFSQYDRTVPYELSVNLIREDGRYQHVGDVISANTIIGYHANQSDKYLELEGVRMLMHNVRESKPLIRYVYGDTIPYTVLVGYNVGGWDVYMSCKDSAFNQIGNVVHIQDQKYGSSSFIFDRGLTIPSSARSVCYYVDIWFGSDPSQYYRFNVIKPLKATEYYQRVEWRNEYGGISFFDFTGAKTETDNVNIETFEKNVFDYHQNVSEFERKKIYKNDYDKTVKLTSHLMEEQGKWIFNSLMLSKSVWTYINGKKYYIIPKSVEVNEDNTYNNIYKATLTYTYSDI